VFSRRLSLPGFPRALALWGALLLCGALALAAAAQARQAHGGPASPDGRYRGAAQGAPSIVARVQGRRVAAFSVTVRNYRCELGGDVGPLTARVEPAAAVGAGGRVAFMSGERAERVRVDARISRGVMRGRLRVLGTIATGQPCRSARVTFAVRRR